MVTLLSFPPSFLRSASPFSPSPRQFEKELGSQFRDTTHSFFPFFFPLATGLFFFVLLDNGDALKINMVRRDGCLSSLSPFPSYRSCGSGSPFFFSFFLWPPAEPHQSD